MALEWSENKKILAQIFKWVEQQAERTDNSESCPPTENDSEMLETVGNIKREATEEPANSDVIAAEVDGSLTQSQPTAEASLENPNGNSIDEAVGGIKTEPTEELEDPGFDITESELDGFSAEAAQEISHDQEMSSPGNLLWGGEQIVDSLICKPFCPFQTVYLSGTDAYSEDVSSYSGQIRSGNTIILTIMMAIVGTVGIRMHVGLWNAGKPAVATPQFPVLLM